MRRKLLLLALTVVLLASGQNAGNQMMTYADLSTYVTSGLFYTNANQSVVSSQQMVTAGAYATLILHSGTPGYASNQLITYNDALTDSTTPSPTPTPVSTPTPNGGSATASPGVTATPTSVPTARPTVKPTLDPTDPPSHQNPAQ